MVSHTKIREIPHSIEAMFRLFTFQNNRKIHRFPRLNGSSEYKHSYIPGPPISGTPIPGARNLASVQEIQHLVLLYLPKTGQYQAVNNNIRYQSSKLRHTYIPGSEEPSPLPPSRAQKLLHVHTKSSPEITTYNIKPRNDFIQYQASKQLHTKSGPETTTYKIRPRNHDIQYQAPKQLHTISSPETTSYNIRPRNNHIQYQAPKTRHTISSLETTTYNIRPRTTSYNIRPRNNHIQHQAPKQLHTISGLETIQLQTASGPEITTYNIKPRNNYIQY